MRQPDTPRYPQMKSFIKNLHPAYGAVLLLLAGQLILGMEERKRSSLFNQCVHYSTNGEKVKGKNYSSTSSYPLNHAVFYCNGGR